MMDQNTQRKFPNKALLLAVFIGTVGTAIGRFTFDSLAVGFFAGAPLGAILGITVYWMVPNKRPLAPEGYYFWCTITLAGCALMMTLASLMRGDLSSALNFVILGSCGAVICRINWQEKKSLRLADREQA